MMQPLQIDAAACDGVGICAVVAGDVITLDQWGFPVIGDTVDPGLLRQARRAARACPHRALRVAEAGRPT
jgi:ferredoxin